MGLSPSAKVKSSARTSSMNAILFAVSARLPLIRTFMAKGVGRQLMEAVLKRAQGSTGVRLVADSFNMSSVSLYASLGFEIKEPLLLMSGRPASKPSREIEVRPLENDDVGDCAVLCGRVHGCERTNELRDAVINLSPLVAFREGKVAGYVLTFTTWPSNHAVADGEEAIQSSLLAAAILNSGPLSFLLPVRQANLYRWCLSEGFRAVLPMTLMALGKYQDPDGFYMSSILY